MNKQTGSALILSMLILLVMTLLGITAMSTSSLEEKMAANDRNQKISFQNAELTLSDSEGIVLDPTFNYYEDIKTGIVDSTSVGYYDIGTTFNYFSNAAWNAGTTCISTAHNQSDNNACYIVEIVREAPALEVGGGYSSEASQSTLRYNILNLTARSTDTNGATVSMVQSAVQKRLIEN